mmetsp:Transcript_43506/g.136457  ORF Transcript_43506/g.136457 Transcript_43506/m.136457 type:complete len:583 (+) Transcript_43506:60-1808(+)
MKGRSLSFAFNFLHVPAVVDPHVCLHAPQVVRRDLEDHVAEVLSVEGVPARHERDRWERAAPARAIHHAVGAKAAAACSPLHGEQQALPRRVQKLAEHEPGQAVVHGHEKAQVVQVLQRQFALPEALQYGLCAAPHHQPKPVAQGLRGGVLPAQRPRGVAGEEDAIHDLKGARDLDAIAARPGHRGTHLGPRDRRRCAELPRAGNGVAAPRHERPRPVPHIGRFGDGVDFHLHGAILWEHRYNHHRERRRPRHLLLDGGVVRVLLFVARVGWRREQGHVPGHEGGHRPGAALLLLLLLLLEALAGVARVLPPRSPGGPRLPVEPPQHRGPRLHAARRAVGPRRRHPQDPLQRVAQGRAALRQRVEDRRAVPHAEPQLLRGRGPLRERHGEGHEPDLTGEHVEVAVERLRLAVGADARRRPVAEALDVEHVAHAELALEHALVAPPHRAGVQRDAIGGPERQLHATARGRVQAKEGAVHRVALGEVAHVPDGEVHVRRVAALQAGAPQRQAQHHEAGRHLLLHVVLQGLPGPQALGPDGARELGEVRHEGPRLGPADAVDVRVLPVHVHVGQQRVGHARRRRL